MSTLLAQTYDDLLTISTSDTDNLPRVCMGLLVTGAGSLKVITRSGTTISLAAVVVGYELRVPVTKVFATGTSATVTGLIGAPYGGAVGGS